MLKFYKFTVPIALERIWGNPNVVRQRLGNAVQDVVFDRSRMLIPALSPAHNREMVERTAGPVLKLVEYIQGTV